MTHPKDTANAALELALKFHETYERLAPQFGYETRTETREFDPESANGKLMIAVCAALQAQPAQDDGLTIAISHQRADITQAAANPDTVALLREVERQLEYMDERSPSGTTPATLAKVRAHLTKLGEAG